jgi:hypothetical protein
MRFHREKPGFDGALVPFVSQNPAPGFAGGSFRGRHSTPNLLAVSRWPLGPRRGANPADRLPRRGQLPALARPPGIVLH